MARVPVLVNPAAGRGRFLDGHAPSPRLRRVLAALSDHGFVCDLVLTERPGHATALAGDWARRGAPCVFALGGDGMLRETAQGLVGTETALAPLPAGTANVLAPALGLPSGALAAADAYRRPLRVRAVDVGRCGNAVFLMMASRGLDARALVHVQAALKRRLGKAGVAFAGIREWLRASEPGFELHCNGQGLRATFAAVCNVAGYGGVTKLAPAADPTDGKLDLVAFSGEGRARTLAFVLAALLRLHSRLATVHSAQIEELELPGEGDVLLQLDGDPFTFQLPLRITIDPQKLLVPAPADAESAS